METNHNYSCCSILCYQSETHYSLKEMETWLFNTIKNLIKKLVGNPLLSERDGNRSFKTSCFSIFRHRRKPTTLWKRWKRRSFKISFFSISSSSETHYSLKEMETPVVRNSLGEASKSVGNPLLSERDGNIITFQHLNKCCSSLSETHYSLKEMETTSPKRSKIPSSKSVGNPLLSERDGNCTVKPLCFKPALNMSETHYSLKEMETQQPKRCWQTPWIFVGNPLLSERDGNLTSNVPSSSSSSLSRKPTTLWKRWKQHAY